VFNNFCVLPVSCARLSTLHRRDIDNRISPPNGQLLVDNSVSTSNNAEVAKRQKPENAEVANSEITNAEVVKSQKLPQNANSKITNVMNSQNKENAVNDADASNDKFAPVGLLQLRTNSQAEGLGGMRNVAYGVGGATGAYLGVAGVGTAGLAGGAGGLGILGAIIGGAYGVGLTKARMATPNESKLQVYGSDSAGRSGFFILAAVLLLICVLACLGAAFYATQRGIKKDSEKDCEAKERVLRSREAAKKAAIKHAAKSCVAQNPW